MRWERIEPDQPLSAERLCDVADAAEHFIAGNGAAIVPGGVIFTLPALRQCWGKITGVASGKFSWVEVYLDPDTLTWTAIDGGLAGTTTVNYAIERNGRTAATNWIALLSLHESGEFYTFDWDDAGGGGGGVTGSGTTGKLPKFTGATAIGDSIASESGGVLTVGGDAKVQGTLGLYDTDSSNYLTLDPGSNLTADRTLTLTTGDTDRTLDISAADVTVSSFGASLVDDANASTARTTMGLGTSAVVDIGTSGAKVPLLDGTNTWSNPQTFPNSSGIKIRDTDGSHTLGVVGGSNLTADRTLTLTTGDGNRTFDMSSGDVTISSFGASLVDDANASTARTTMGLGTSAVIDTGTSGTKVPLLDGANTWSASQTFPNSSGIKIQDTDNSHTLGIVGGSNLSANRTFTITPGDASRSLTMSGDLTVPASGTAVIADGVSGGQTIKGDTASGGQLVLQSTSHATKGGVKIAASDWLLLPEVSAPGTPASGFGALYYKTDGTLYSKNDGGTETALGGGGGGVGTLLASGSVSAAATMSITWTNSSYKFIRIYLYNVFADAMASNLYARTSTDGGATWDSGANDYGSAANKMTVTSSLPDSTMSGGGAQNFLTLEAVLFDPSGSGYKLISFQGNTLSSGTAAALSLTSGFRAATADIDGIRFYAGAFMGSPNISGSYAVYGY